MANFFNDNEHLRFHLNHPMMKKIVRLKENDFKEREEFDHAPLDHEDAMDSYEKVLEIVGEIAGETIHPNAEDVDHDGPVLLNNEVRYAAGTQEDHDVLVKAGLVGMSLPRKYDGLNFPMVPYVIAAEIVSRADAGFANIWGLQDCAETIHEFASEEIKNEFLPRFNKGATAAMILTEPDAGSDLQAVQLKANFDAKTQRWYLNGVKRFITNGDADISLVLARTEQGTSDARGLSLFVYDRKEKSVNIRRIENKLGIKGSPTCEMVFNNAPARLIGETRKGLIKYVMSLMNSARLGVGAQSVGIAEAAYREALKYAYEREQFGKAIIQYPAIYELLGLMQAKIHASRSLLYETARFVDVYKSYTFLAEERKLEPEERAEQKYYSRNADILTPLVKLFASEYCNQVTYDAIQIHGGTGYMKDFAVERLYRDARITTIYEGTSQLQVVAAIRAVVNGAYLKLMQEYASRPVHPELDYLKNYLLKMTDQFMKVVVRVHEGNDNEMLDFHARRLVEVAGNTIMGYLLLLDAEKNREYLQVAEIFIQKARAANIADISFINNFDTKDLGAYKRLSNV